MRGLLHRSKDDTPNQDESCAKSGSTRALVGVVQRFSRFDEWCEGIVQECFRHRIDRYQVPALARVNKRTIPSQKRWRRRSPNTLVGKCAATARSRRTCRQCAATSSAPPSILGLPVICFCASAFRKCIVFSWMPSKKKLAPSSATAETSHKQASQQWSGAKSLAPQTIIFELKCCDGKERNIASIQSSIRRLTEKGNFEGVLTNLPLASPPPTNWVKNLHVTKGPKASRQEVAYS